MRAEVDHGLRAVFAAEHERLWRSLLAYASPAELRADGAAGGADPHEFAPAIGRLPGGRADPGGHDPWDGRAGRRTLPA